ncbi:MAG: hypothetical protein H6561_22185 [Lewinellaceae bacterium]|nr:hypothetical protein [Lewinellaceae bacterium]HPQ97987.1 hypothetical protein [Saprospiraceae bacterium]HQU53533.1 hypothetical protein [Saprospiraceae bacterium]
MDLTLIISIATSVMSLLVALISVIIMYRSVKISQKGLEKTLEEMEDYTISENLEIHVQVVNAIRQHQSQLPPNIHDPDYVMTEEVNRRIRMFWFSIFDEWFVCNTEGKFMTDYWEKYYKYGLLPVMKRPVFTQAIKKMIEVDHITFLGQVRAFSKSLNEVHQMVKGEDLIDYANIEFINPTHKP